MQHRVTYSIVRKTIGVAFVLAWLVVPASADSLPSAFYASTISGNAGHLNQHTSPGTISTADGSVTLGSSPSTYIDVDCVQPTSINGSSSGCLGSENYYFEFSGAAGTVQADISYSMSFSEDPSLGGADMFLSLVDLGGSGVDYACLGGNGSNCFSDHTEGSLMGTFHDTLNANQVYELMLNVFASVGAGPAGTTTDAFLDPVISLDPSVTGSYSLLLSDGVGDSSFSTGTPEPASWWLMAAGLGAFALFRLRRRRAIERQQ